MKCTPSLPRLWLFTDTRLGGADPGDPLWQAIGALPAGAGLVFRHYGLPDGQRRALLRAVARVARARRLLLVVAAAPVGMPARHRHWPAGMVGRGGRAPGVQTAAAHSGRELVKAAQAGADLIFLSPVFATRSHPGGKVLGPVRFGLALRHHGASSVPIVALGGMNAGRGRRMRALGAAGWAAIEAWAGNATERP